MEGRESPIYGISEFLSTWCSSSSSNAVLSSAPTDTPSQRVQFLLGAEDDDEEHMPHDLFTEMDEICVRDGEDSEWRESARYS